jgi:hypothetical protein
MKLSTELLKEIYNAVDENLKAKIENEVPKIKPSLDYNRWIKTNYFLNEKWLVYVNPDGSYYGFDANSDWVDTKTSYNPLTDKSNYYATPEEVETALINEAKRRGFEGKIIYCIKGEVGSKSTKLINGAFEFNNNNELRYQMLNCGYTIFYNGTWATIIPETTQKELLQKQVDELKRQIDLL